MAGLILMFIFGVLTGVCIACGWQMISELNKKARGRKS